MKQLNIVLKSETALAGISMPITLSINCSSVYVLCAQFRLARR